MGSHLHHIRGWELQTRGVYLSSGLAELLSVSSLTSLDLSECPHISGTEMVKGLKGSKASRANLEMLNLKSCTYVRVGEQPWGLLSLCR